MRLRHAVWHVATFARGLPPVLLKVSNFGAKIQTFVFKNIFFLYFQLPLLKCKARTHIRKRFQRNFPRF